MKGKRTKIKLVTPQATLEFGELLGKYLTAGDCVALIGDLGTGKTQLAKGLARGLGVPGEYYITSPTYTIINEYPGRIPLYHFDLYRLGESSDLEDLGYEEYFDGRGVTVIEWAEKITHLLPENRMEIHLRRLKRDVRGLEVIGFGDHYEEILDEIARVSK
ncbi:MAG: tRNA (adenosine(37)-N6)-threonylcarbamoyltransferase complex ATPase subunit type 1 TsaE [Pseudomonadota bacterium]